MLQEGEHQALVRGAIIMLRDLMVSHYYNIVSSVRQVHHLGMWLTKRQASWHITNEPVAKGCRVFTFHPVCKATTRQVPGVVWIPHCWQTWTRGCHRSKCCCLQLTLVGPKSNLESDGRLLARLAPPPSAMRQSGVPHSGLLLVPMFPISRSCNLASQVISATNSTTLTSLKETLTTNYLQL